ncbi:MAG: gliding motility protein GldD [Tannerella sp.]|jgi:gliding motility-associated lipoprotein GldD|nr:gliding motility protein GldD [Tannerella sp.]
MNSSLRLAVTGLLLGAGVSCTEYTPKPRGLYRIDIPEAHYREFAADGLPCTFRVSRLVTVELPPPGAPAGWINLSYGTLNASIYCSYCEITPETLPAVTEECRTLLLRSVKEATAITEQSYEDREIPLYATLFRIAGESASPIQFTLTDSVRRFFRGALYYQCRMDADSLAPVTGYVGKDVVELIQSFQWK